MDHTRRSPRSQVFPVLSHLPRSRPSLSRLATTARINTLTAPPGTGWAKVLFPAANTGLPLLAVCISHPKATGAGRIPRTSLLLAGTNQVLTGSTLGCPVARSGASLEASLPSVGWFLMSFLSVRFHPPRCPSSRSRAGRPKHLSPERPVILSDHSDQSQRETTSPSRYVVFAPRIPFPKVRSDTTNTLPPCLIPVTAAAWRPS